MACSGNNTVLRRSFCTLNPALWLNDEVINYFTCCIIAPSCPNIHVFSSFFWTLLLERGTGYCYHEV